MVTRLLWRLVTRLLWRLGKLWTAEVPEGYVGCGFYFNLSESHLLLHVQYCTRSAAAAAPIAAVVLLLVRSWPDCGTGSTAELL
jgi:hypothetical protein